MWRRPAGARRRRSAGFEAQYAVAPWHGFWLLDNDRVMVEIVPETLERRVLAAFEAGTRWFRKTSCAVAYAHGLPDYNGHYGIRELCDICPLSQLELCARAHQVPTAHQLQDVVRVLPEAKGLVVIDITERAAVVAGLTEEQPRYYLQHALGFQVHDVRHPHHHGRHGRADIGWKDGKQNG